MGINENGGICFSEHVKDCVHAPKKRARILWSLTGLSYEVPIYLGKTLLKNYVMSKHLFRSYNNITTAYNNITTAYSILPYI